MAGATSTGGKAGSGGSGGIANARLVAKAVATGYNHDGAVLADGTIRCWGLGGALGNGTTTDSSVPVTVIGF